MSAEETEFVSWAWDVLLMLKLHPQQVLLHSMQTLAPVIHSTSTDTGVGDRSHDHHHDDGQSGSSQGNSLTCDRASGAGFLSAGPSDCDSHSCQANGTQKGVAKDPGVYRQCALGSSSGEIVLPNLTSSSERELADLRDAVKNEGLLASYIALCLSSLGAE